MAGEGIATAVLGSLINRALNSAFGDPAAEADLRQNTFDFAQKSVSLGIPVKPAQLTNLDPITRAQFEVFQASPQFKDLEAQAKQQMQNRQGIQAALQAATVQQPGGQARLDVPSSFGIQPGTLFQQGSPFGQRVAQATQPGVQPTPTALQGPPHRVEPTPTDIAARQAQLTPAARAQLTGKVEIGQLAEQRLNRIATAATARMQSVRLSAAESQRFRASLLNFSTNFVTNAGGTAAQIPLLAKGLRTGKMDPRVAGLETISVADRQVVTQAARHVAKYGTTLGQIRNALKSKRSKNIDLGTKEAQLVEANRLLAQGLFVLEGKNAAVAEQKFKNQARFVSDDGKSIVAFGEISEERQKEKLAIFRQAVGTAFEGLDPRGAAILERLFGDAVPGPAQPGTAPAAAPTAPALLPTPQRGATPQR